MKAIPPFRKSKFVHLTERISLMQTHYIPIAKESSTTHSTVSFRSDNIPLLLTDIDGEQNGGSYAPDSVSVSFKDVDVTGGDGGWYLGEATKEITIVLKEKKEEIKK